MENDSPHSSTASGCDINEVKHTPSEPTVILQFCPCTVNLLGDIQMLENLVMESAQRRVEYLQSRQIARPKAKRRYHYIPLKKLDSVERNLREEYYACVEMLTNVRREMTSHFKF